MRPRAPTRRRIASGETVTEVGTGAGAIPGSNDSAGWARILLIVAAAIELVGSLAAVPLLFLDVPQLPGPPLTGTLITVRLLAQPVLALAALVFAIQHRTAFAVYAMAALIIVMWTSFLPTFVEHGLQLDGYMAVHTLYELIAMPLLAGVAAALATARQKIAALLVTLPTLLDLFSVIAFAISSAVFGD